MSSKSWVSALMNPRVRKELFRKKIVSNGYRSRFGDEEFAVMGKAENENSILKNVRNGGIVPDVAQEKVAKALTLFGDDELYCLRPWRKAKGLYMHGPVGLGKSVLLDCFAKTMEKEKGKTVRRIHFHDFMLDVHLRLRTRTLSQVASDVSAEIDFLAFDEFQVTDVADAVLLYQLFQGIFDAETKVVATSNRAPKDLYENGLNRKALFEPFEKLIEFECIVTDFGRLHGNEVPEYRSLAKELDNGEFVSTTFVQSGKRQDMDDVFIRLAKNPEIVESNKEIPVAMNRKLKIPMFANDVGRFTFKDLCENPLGPLDYLAIVQHCDVVMVDSVPPLVDKMDGITRRFIMLIDILYDRNKKLVIGSEHRLDEILIGISEKQKENLTVGVGEIHVTDKGGGSSSRLTTMLDNNIEWSATGRMGASLARGDDVSFAIDRARSRLLEMQTSKYWSSSSSS